MRRSLAIVAVLSLFALQAQTLAFHVHAVSDHADDRDHRHGPAIHHHDNVDEDLHVSAAASSAAGQVITIVIPAAISESELVVSAEVTEAPRVSELQLIGGARAIDVRSHGPPQSRTAFVRGPPASSQS